jgi:hypothetical protein
MISEKPEGKTVKIAPVLCLQRLNSQRRKIQNLDSGFFEDLSTPLGQGKLLRISFPKSWISLFYSKTLEKSLTLLVWLISVRISVFLYLLTPKKKIFQ